MNILIVGEFSGFAKHLKCGFENNGHRVIITLTGDGFKQFKPSGEDILYNSSRRNIFGVSLRGSDRLMAPLVNFRLNRLIRSRFKSGIDLIVVINPIFLSSNIFQCGVKVHLLKKYIKGGSKLIMSICGTDIAMRYSFPWFNKQVGWGEVQNDKRYDFLLRNSDSIIPTAYMYYYAIHKYCSENGYTVEKISNAIPLPIKISPISPFSTCVGRKIVIFHGITRPNMKGTPFIKEAMDQIQTDYPDLVECIYCGGLPYDEYVNLFERVDILVDQVYGNGWGVNATIGALNGKCVLTPCGPENSVNMGIPDIPFVKITPDSKQIYNVLKSLILNPTRIDKIKRDSRFFVEKYCDCTIVANEYLRRAYLLNK